MWRALSTVGLFLFLSLSQSLDASSIQPKGPWTEVRTAHFRLVGDASKATLLTVGRDLEDLRSVLTQLSQLNLDAPQPTTIYVFKNASRLRPFLPPTPSGEVPLLDGAFFRQPHGNYLLVNGDNPQKVRRLLFHEYVHFFVAHNLPAIPLWLEEGMAELYSTFESNGSQAILGKARPQHLTWLRRNPWIPLQELIAVDRSSPIYNENERKGAFYAQSWLLVHYLFHGHEDGSKVLGRLLQKLFSTTPDRAFQQALGGPFPFVESNLRRYAGQDVFLSRSLPIASRPATPKPAAPSQSSELPPAEAQALLGELLAFQEGRSEEATQLLSSALEKDPSLVAARRALGLAAETGGDPVLAGAHYDRALKDRPDDPWLRAFSLRARLQSGEDRRLVRSGLERLTQQSPDFPLAWKLLAATYSEPDLPRRDVLKGIPVFEKALELSPHNLGLAKGLLRLYIRQNRRVDIERLNARYFRPRGLDVHAWPPSDGELPR